MLLTNWQICPLCREPNACATPSGPGCWCNQWDLSKVDKTRVMAQLESQAAAFKRTTEQNEPATSTQSCLCAQCMLHLGAEKSTNYK